MPSLLRRLSKLFGSSAPKEDQHTPESVDPGFDMIWFQHFHKAGGTSVIQAAEMAGYQFFDNNINGNPMTDPHTPIPLWDWDKAKLSDWLAGQHENGVTFVCAEFGFSHEVFDIKAPRLRRVGTIRRPKQRLVSNFIYDVAEGYTPATKILDYIQPRDTHTMPDYYTRLVTQDSGKAAREAAIQAIKRLDYVSVLEEPETFPVLQSYIPGLTRRHANKTDYEGEAVQAARESVLASDEELEALCADETELYNAVRDAFASK